MPTNPSVAGEAQTQIGSQCGQENIDINTTTFTSREMPTTLFLMPKKDKKENPKTKPRSNPKSTPQNQTQRNANANQMANSAQNSSDEEILAATEEMENRDRLKKVQEAKKREEEERTKKKLLAVKPPKEKEGNLSDEELLSAALALEHLQRGQGEEEHPHHNQEPGHHDDGVHRGEQQEGQAQVGRDAQHFPDHKPSSDIA